MRLNQYTETRTPSLLNLANPLCLPFYTQGAAIQITAGATSGHNIGEFHSFILLCSVSQSQAQERGYSQSYSHLILDFTQTQSYLALASQATAWHWRTDTCECMIRLVIALFCNSIVCRAATKTMNMIHARKQTLHCTVCMRFNRHTHTRRPINNKT